MFMWSRFGVFRGLYETNLTARVRAAKKAVSLGAQGIDIDVPYASDAQWLKDVHDVISSTASPNTLVMIQDNTGVPTSTLAELADREPQFVALKCESSADAMWKASAVQNATGPGRLAIGANSDAKFQMVNTAACKRSFSLRFHTLRWCCVAGQD